MNKTLYKTQEWYFDAFEYEPHGWKPEWWHDMIVKGQAFEFAPVNDAPAYAQFGDKRSTHKAFIGDWITRDQFGRIDVYARKNFAKRAKLISNIDEKSLASTA